MPTVRNLAPIVQRLEEDIDQCLDGLSQRLQVVCTLHGTHRVLSIAGLDRSSECLRQLAIYCVGRIAQAVQVNLDVKADLLGITDDDAHLQLMNDVCSLIGESNEALSDGQKGDERDPWLFEALSHLFIHLSRRERGFFPLGTLVGLTMTHTSAKEHGLDLVGIYAGATVGLGIGESKAREHNPWRALAEAAGKFTQVDLGKYDGRLRAIVGQMRGTMPAQYRGQITQAFWKDERAYLPYIGYSSEHNPEWTSDKDALRSLGVPSTHRILVPLGIDGFRAFFDELADEMRAYLQSLGEC